MSRFNSNNPNPQPGTETTELERQVKAMLNRPKTETNNEEEIILSPKQKQVEEAGAKITTTKFKQKSPLSCRLDEDLIQAMNLLVNAKKFFEGDNKACVNQIVALAVKDYVEKPENAARIRKMKSMQNL